MLHKLNSNKQWRIFLGKPHLDLHSRDFELLVRVFAFLIEKESYSPSLTKFLNIFSKKAKSFDEEKISYLETLFNKFMSLSAHLSSNVFINIRTGKFNAFLFESVFYATCIKFYENRTLPEDNLNSEKITKLDSNQNFQKTTNVGTTSSVKIAKRFDVAVKIVNS